VAVNIANNVATINMPGNIRNQIRNAAEETVSFDLSGIYGLETAVMSRSDWNNFANAGLGMEIAMPAGTLSFDNDAARSVHSRSTGATIASTIYEVNPATLPAQQQNAIGASDIVFRISLAANRNYITEFEGNLSITVPFEGEPPVGAWRVGTNGELEQLEATFNPADSTVTFITNRLSIFKVGTDTAAISAPGIAPAVAQTAMLRFAIGVGDIAPFIDIETERTMVPLRAVAEGLGADVDWNNTTRTVYISQGGEVVSLTIDTPLPGGMGIAVIENGRTFVPVRYVSEILGAYVRWDAVNRAVYIYR
jgi:hypothetical protein